MVDIQPLLEDILDVQRKGIRKIGNSHGVLIASGVIDIQKLAGVKTIAYIYSQTDGLIIRIKKVQK